MGVMVSTNISFAVYIIIKIVLHLFFCRIFHKQINGESKFIIVIDGYVNTHPIRLQLFDLLIYPVPF